MNYNIIFLKSLLHLSVTSELTHWGRVTHICVGNLTIIGSDNGLSPGRRQAIIWTNAVILSLGPLGTNFSEILAEIITFSFKKMYLIVSSAKWRPFCLGPNVLTMSGHINSGLLVTTKWVPGDRYHNCHDMWAMYTYCNWSIIDTPLTMLFCDNHCIIYHAILPEFQLSQNSMAESLV